ncbi:unnamed protein product, partial [Staurois parvus]
AACPWWQERVLCCLHTGLSPVSFTSYCTLQSSVLTLKHKHSHIVKHTQHTVNPLITPHVNPFLPSAISTVSVLFNSIDHCIGVTGDVSDIKSLPRSVRMPAAVPL